MKPEPARPDEPQGPTLPFTFDLKDGRPCVMRAALEDDAEELCGLLPRMDTETDFLSRFPGEFDKTVEQERAFIREHGGTPDGIFLAAEVDGRIVGLGGAAVQKLRRFKHHREFGLAVLEAFWNQGIGRTLTETVISWAKERGLRKLTLKVHADNSRAVALYEAFGFVTEGRLVGDILKADGSYGDVIVMAKFFQGP